MSQQTGVLSILTGRGVISVWRVLPTPSLLWMLTKVYRNTEQEVKNEASPTDGVGDGLIR